MKKNYLKNIIVNDIITINFENMEDDYERKNLY